MIKNDILKYLCENLQARNKTPELDQVIQSLQDLINENEQLVKQKIVLSKEQAETLQKKYQNFVKLCEKYCKEAKTGTEVYDIKAALPLVKSYIGMFSNISMGLEENVTMEEVLGNDFLLMGLFQQDSGIADIKNYRPDANKNIIHFTPKEALDAYKSAISGIPKTLGQHLAKVVREPDAQDWRLVFGILEAKLRLIGRVLDMNHAPQAAENPDLIDQISKRWKQLIKDSQLSNTHYPHNHISKDLYDRTYSSQLMDMTRIIGDILNRTDLNDVAKRLLEGELFKLKISSSMTGLNNMLWDYVDAYLNAVMAPVFSVYETMKLNNLDPKMVKNDTAHPAHAIFLSVENIREKAEKYIRGEENAEPPAMEDFKNYAKEIEKYIEKNPILVQGRGKIQNIDGFIASGMKMLQTMAGYYDDLQPDFDRVLKAYQKKVQMVYKENLRILYATSYKQDDFGELTEVALKKIEGLAAAGLISQKQLNHAQVIDLARNYDTVYQKYVKEAEDDLEKRKHSDPEDVIDEGPGGIKVTNKSRAESDSRILWFASVLAKEKDHELKAANTELPINNRKMHINKVSKPVMAAFEKDTLTDEEAQAFLEYYDRWVNIPDIKQFMSESNMEDFPKNFGSKDFRVHVLRSCWRMPSNDLHLLDEEVAALTQTSGNLGTANSEKYEAVKLAYETLNQHHLPGTQDHIPDGHSFTALYNACSNYLLSHKSVPGSPNGKLRYNTIAKVLGTIAVPIMNSMPEVADQVERDIFVNMIRNKQFRNIMVDNAQHELEKMKNLDDQDFNQEKKNLYGIYAKIIRFGQELETALAGTRHDMIICKIRTKEEYVKIFEKFEHAFDTASDFANAAKITSGNSENRKNMIDNLLAVDLNAPAAAPRRR